MHVGLSTSRSSFSSCAGSRPHTTARQQFPHGPRRTVRACAGRRSQGNYYELLGIDVDASEDEVKAAFRRRAKELHPDVNSEEDAEQAFIQVNNAYETLSDEDKRMAYNRMHGIGLRRMNFFQDVDFEDGLPFSWQRRRHSARPDDDDLDEDDEFFESTPFGRDFRRRWGRQQSSGGFRWSDLSRDADEDDGAPGSSCEDDSDGASDDEEGSTRDAKSAADFEAQRLEALLGVLGRMSASGVTMKDWGSGRLDPWGTSTSAAWHKKVAEQTSDPFANRGRFGDDFGLGQRGPYTPEWTPPGRGEDDLGGGRIGWMPPGREFGRDRGGSSRRWGGDDGGFSGWPL